MFFGCYSEEVVIIIWIFNFNYIFISGQLMFKIQYYCNEMVGMISNGVEVGNYGGKENWFLCLVCGIMKKNGEQLLVGCVVCFEEYCFN